MTRLRCRPTLARAFALALALAFGALASGAEAAHAAVQVSVTGPDGRGPQAPDAQGRFRFDGLTLRGNSTNTFTVTARDESGRTISKDVSITQLSLQSVVVARVTATPLPPERVIQLVEDGVIDLDDPDNFNVSTFQIVLSIGREEIPIEIPIATPVAEEVTGFEAIQPKSDPGDGRGTGRPPDTEIVVFDEIVACDSCESPPRIPGVIIIEGNIRSLKEFFSVRLLLMNLSGLFTLTDVRASLEFPDAGLTPILPQDGVAVFDAIEPGSGEVPGQKEREFIVRGDEIGRRPIRVNFGGFVTGPGIPEDAPVPFSGSADTEVEVKGPPEFLVRVSHPDRVDAGVPYELRVDITNAGDAPALYASLDLDVGADADLVECQPPEAPEADPACEPIDGPVVRQLQHLYPGERVVESFTVLPYATGDITSCIGVSSQNVQLQVLVGAIGCLTGKLPTTRGVPAGVPTASVVPYPNAIGVGVDAPVVAFFSERMDEGSITLGPSGSFRVFGPTGEIAPGQLRFAEVTGKTVAIWQSAAGRLEGNSRYTVRVTTGARDRNGNALFADWTSTFDTTDPSEDGTPPQLTLGIEPGVDPLRVIPGQIVQVNAYAADQGSGVARIELRLRDESAPDAAADLVDQKTRFGAEEGPTIFAIDSGRLVPGHTYQAIATAIDGAGNAQEGTIPFVLQASVQPPTIALPTDPLAPVLQGVSVDLTPVQVASTARSVAFFVDGAAEPVATSTLAPFQTRLATLELPLGLHTVRAVVTDAIGQIGEDVLAFELIENPSEPVVSFTGAADGAQVLAGAALDVVGRAEDPTGIRVRRFALDDPNGPELPSTDGAVRIETSPLAPGAHRLYLIATNALGVSNDPANPDSSLEFVVTAPGTGPPPPAPALDALAPPAAGRVVVSGSSAPGARVVVRNVRSGIELALVADAGGRWSGALEAEPGDRLEASVLDLAQSAERSRPASAIVPAPRALVGIALAPGAFTLAGQNATRDLVVTGTYADGGSEVLTGAAGFTTSDAGVASVSAAGRVVANRRGSATITAQVGAFSATAVVTVEIRTLESIAVSPASVVLPALGATQALTVTGTFSDGTSEALTTALSFASSAPLGIGISPSGVVSALAATSATITVTRAGFPPVLVPVRVDVSADQPPAVAFQAPAAGAGFERGQTVTVTALATDGAGVVRVGLTASGAASFSETRQISPVATSASPGFSFAVPSDAPIGGTITLSLQAEDTGGLLSTVATRTISVVDRTDPVVTILSPAIDAGFAFGAEVEVRVAASDAAGVSEIRFEVAGLDGAAGVQTVVPPAAEASATFRFTIPSDLVSPQVQILAYASDVAGNEGASAPVPITVTGLDSTPPATVATAASAPAGATTTVSYEVTDGLADLHHVELYFRRNGIGTFNRYTGPLGTGTGEYTPQSGATGTIAFDATRMGGDGSYEFFTVGVDRSGNREAPPEEAGSFAGDAGVLATFATGAPVTVITTDTEIASDVLDGASLRVVGATLTLVGTRSFGNVELLEGAVLTHRETTQTEAYGIELSAWTITVDATSRIDVVGRGHLGGNRSGLGEVAHTSGFEPGAQNGSGGSYGGLGGDFSGNGASAPNPVYGNLVNPVDLGSGGGAWGGAGGDGGGRVLVGAINVTLDGAITANGGLSAGSASGEGSGGSVNLTLRTLSGVGAISADGGTTNGGNHTGGGGGRIAIRTLDRATYDASRITTRGGDGFYGDGADGTAVLIGEGDTGTELVINGLGAGSSITDLILPPGQTFDSITLQNGANVMAQGPIVLSRTLLLRGNSRLAHPTASEAGLSITAREVIVESGSAIDVTGRGYLAGNRSGLGETAHTLGFAPGSAPGTGGSHGGLGGDWSGNGASLPGTVYGDPKRPNRLGAGGGAWGGAGGDGGGYVRIVASDRVVVDGAIRANGGISSGSASGEGAGGSIWIDTARLAGTGTISADGGNLNNANHTGGGGGRVALYAEFIDPNADLGGLRNVTANGGDGFYGDGAAGTVFLQLPGDVDGTLIADGVRAPGQTNPLATELPPIGPGIAVSVTADSLVLDGRLPRANAPNALVGLRINPNRDQAESFEIASNTADTITVVTPNENGVAFATVAEAGASYAGEWRFDEILLQRGGNLEVADPLVVARELRVTETSLLAHPETTNVYAADLVIDAGTITIDATSRIDVSGRGYLGGNRAGLGETAHTVGFTPGAQPATGGSHGGLGGRWPGNGGGVTNPVYGDPAEPRELGAGGGAWSGAGGDGGGRIAIVADALVVDGALRADGGISSGSASGEGAGGSLDLRVGSLEGAGVISASGGSLNGGNHTGGGGGRIAIRHGGTLGFPLANVRATGGDGFYGDGGHGSVFVLAPGQANGDVIYDGHGFTSPVDSVVIPETLVADNLILRDGVRAVGRQIAVDTLRVEAGATLTHAPQSPFGLELNVRRLEVASGAAIDATGRGHLGGNRAGLGETAHTLNFTPGSERATGGSHGGLGGRWTGNGGAIAAPIFGDVRRPAQLGGGGGAWSGAGGDGGGIVRVFASESVVVDGAIRANGGISSGSASGEGAGGSVWIETGTIGGTGTISADGGTQNGGNHTGGGGGRVAIHADAADASADLLAARRATAYGGDGFYGDGAPGTVFVALGGVETLIFDAGRTTDRWTPEASLPPLGPGLASNVTADSFDVDGTLPSPGIREFHVGGLRVNPDTTQGETFFIDWNDATTIAVRTPNENGVHFGDVAFEGARYAADWRFENVVLRGGASLALFDPLLVDDTLAVTERSLLTHAETTDVYEAALDLEAGTLAIDATSSIDVTARGYLGGNRSGLGETAHTLAFAPGAQAGTGGSYGGLGGDYSANGANLPNPVYGDPNDPLELGSGGGAWDGAGGDGGGRVRVVADALQLDGAIRANGGLSSGTASGEGSGGAVNLRVGALTGSGPISADGGTTNGANHVGGGGGRVLLRHGSGAAPLPNPVSAAAGVGFYGAGQPGTVVLEGP